MERIKNKLSRDEQEFVETMSTNLKHAKQRAEHKQKGWQEEINKSREERRLRKKEETARQKAEKAQRKAEKARQEAEAETFEATEALRKSEAANDGLTHTASKQKRRHEREMARVGSERDKLVKEKKSDKWKIESSQMAEGCRDCMRGKVVASMTKWLQAKVKKGDCFAVVVDLALKYPRHINQAILGFPVHELQVLADGFQYVSNRRTDLVHPTKELLARSTQDQQGEQKAYDRLWEEILGGANVSSNLREVLRQSQPASRRNMREHQDKRDAYTTSYLSAGVAQRHNVSIMQELLFEKDDEREARGVKRSADEASLDTFDSKRKCLTSFDGK